MAIALIVAQPFGTYKIGDEIKDPKVIAEILAGTNAMRCRRVEQPDTPSQNG